MGRGGKWIRGMEKNTAIPQRRHGEIPDEKMLFHWRKWSRRKKAHKRSNEKKAKFTLFCRHSAFPTSQFPEAEPILYWAF